MPRPRSTAGGCTFCSAPGGNAAAAAVVWSPALRSDVLNLSAAPAGSRRGVGLFRLSQLRCPVVVLRTSDNVQHVLIHDRGRSLQLVVSGADVLEPVSFQMDPLFEPARVASQLRALKCLNDLRATGRLPSQLFPVEPRGGRLRLVLQALDGRLNGASHREIAEALLGRARVDADWSDPRGHLRDHVRRAVSRGYALMNGGYRQFLSPRGRL